MSVFVSVEDPEGEPLAGVFELERLFGRFASVPGYCLRFVGEGDDASFNAVQTPLLLAELEPIDATAFGAAERAELVRLVALCRKYAGKERTHIRFYGEASSSE